MKTSPPSLPVISVAAALAVRNVCVFFVFQLEKPIIGGNVLPYLIFHSIGSKICQYCQKRSISLFEFNGDSFCT
jgi:hypothetical protein